MSELVNESGPAAEVRRIGLAALEREFRSSDEMIEISFCVRDRVIQTTTDAATIQRILAILAGVGG